MFKVKYEPKLIQIFVEFDGDVHILFWTKSISFGKKFSQIIKVDTSFCLIWLWLDFVLENLLKFLKMPQLCRASCQLINNTEEDNMIMQYLT